MTRDLGEIEGVEVTEERRPDELSEIYECPGCLHLVCCCLQDEDLVSSGTAPVGEGLDGVPWDVDVVPPAGWDALHGFPWDDCE